MRTYLILCCIAGIVIPYYFALPFFLIHGPNFRLFIEEIFATRISSFFAADLLLSSIIFSRGRAAKHEPATFQAGGWCSSPTWWSACPWRCR
jgi:hypothetical protein